MFPEGPFKSGFAGCARQLGWSPAQAKKLHPAAKVASPRTCSQLVDSHGLDPSHDDGRVVLASQAAKLVGELILKYVIINLHEQKWYYNALQTFN